jgi:alpha-beta hydrolase superfamily lysophospholipase
MPGILRLGAAIAAVLLLSQCTLMPSRAQRPVLGSGEWQAGDGKSMPLTRWPAGEDDVPRRPKAVVICVHGLSGAASDFWPLGQELPKEGIVVYGMQLRGQGNDPDLRRRGDIRRAREWQDDLRDLHQVVATRHTGVPVFWIAESMGALVAMHALASSPPPGQGVRGLILLSPPVGLREPPPRCAYLAARAAMCLFPRWRVSIFSFDEARTRAMQVTSDTAADTRIAETPHFVEKQSLRLLREVEKMIARSSSAGQRLTVPLLVLYTAGDPIASRQHVEQWLAGVASTDKTGVFFPRAFHLILHDEDRWNGVRRISEWVLRRR